MPAIRPRARAVAIGLALVVPAALGACSDDDGGGGGATTAAGTSSLAAPVILDIADLEGADVSLVVGGVVDLTGDTETYTDWNADIAEPAIVEFVPGRDDGSAQFNPGLRALAAGTTDVTLSNTTSGETRTFTVEVTAS